MAIDPERKRRWLQEFYLNGFVVLRGFLPVDFVGRLHEELMPLLIAEFNKEESAGWKRGRAKYRLALEVGPFGDLMRGALADDLYRKNPVIEELVTDILGKWRRGWTQVEVPWKGSRYMNWHSDQTPSETPDMAARHEIVRVTYNLPLVDFTWANGAMELLPGTHWLPRNFLETENIQELNVYPVRLDLRRGDVVLRDGNGLHRGTPNLTDHPRPMLDQTYKKVGKISKS